MILQAELVVQNAAAPERGPKFLQLVKSLSAAMACLIAMPKANVVVSIPTIDGQLQI
jgi:hypothetical protein